MMLLTGHKTRVIFDRYNIINEQELLEAGDQLVEYLAQHAKTAFVRCTIEAVPSVSQGGRAIGVERWRVLSNQIFSRFRRQAAIGV